MALWSSAATRRYVENIVAEGNPDLLLRKLTLQDTSSMSSLFADMMVSFVGISAGR